MNPADRPNNLGTQPPLPPVPKAAEWLAHVLSAGAVAIWVLTADATGIVCCDCFATTTPAYPRGIRLAASAARPLLQALAAGELIGGDRLPSAHKPGLEGRGPAASPSALYAPIRYDGRLRGFISAEPFATAIAWSDQQRTVLRATADLLLVPTGPLRWVAHADQLKETISLLSGTLESTAEGIVVTGLDRRIILANRRFSEMLGLAPDHEPLEGTYIKDYLLRMVKDPDAIVRDAELLYQNPESQAVHCVELLDGRVFERFSVPQRIEGKIIGRIFSYRDITERVRGEELRIRLEAKLQQARKMEAIGALASGIAHDFNNILSAITCNIRLAQGDLPPAHPANESLAGIATATRCATELVQQILTFGRHEIAERQLIFVQPVIREAVGIVKASVPAYITICLNLPDDLPRILAGATHLRQAIMNLCTNAAGAIGTSRGHIDISARSLSVDEHLASTIPDLKTGPYLLITVADDGCGMDQSTIARMFEPFFTTKPRGKGVGLGLAVVHGVMRGHGGAISVASESGKGTRIDLYFPLPETTPEKNTQASGTQADSTAV